MLILLVLHLFNLGLEYSTHTLNPRYLLLLLRAFDAFVRDRDWWLILFLQWTFLVFVFIFELGSLLCAVSSSSNMLIVSRAVAGIGGSGLMNGGLNMITWSVPLQKRPRTYPFLEMNTSIKLICVICSLFRDHAGK